MTCNTSLALDCLQDSAKIELMALLQVGALSDLKKDMAHWQSLLQGRLLEEIEETLYVFKV